MDISGLGFTDELSSLQPGMTIGNLCIVSFIGKGAIGEVYLTQHEVLGKQFTLKVIPKGFSQEEAEKAFKEAARIQNKLDHPNILRIGDLGEEEMFYWLRMEYVEGEKTPEGTVIRNLEDMMVYNNGQLTEQEVCYYIYYLLTGLDHAHSQGIIHHDMKPSNVLIVDEGIKISELGVTDFIGHAWDDFHLLRKNRLMEPTPFEPLPGFSRQLPSLLSTYEYYSPEQYAGNPPTIQSNLYSVGLMAYRMLTGRHCLSMELPSEVTEKIDPEWDNWVCKALAYNPDDRFTSSLEMLQSVPGLEFDEDVGTETQAVS